MSDPTALRVDDLHKSFGAHKVNKGVSMEAQKGEVIAILGASGSSKSTSLRLLRPALTDRRKLQRRRGASTDRTVPDPTAGFGI